MLGASRHGRVGVVAWLAPPTCRPATPSSLAILSQASNILVFQSAWLQPRPHVVLAAAYTAGRTSCMHWRMLSAQRPLVTFQELRRHVWRVMGEGGSEGKDGRGWEG